MPLPHFAGLSLKVKVVWLSFVAHAFGAAFQPLWFGWPPLPPLPPLQYSTTTNTAAAATTTTTSCRVAESKVKRKTLKMPQQCGRGYCLCRCRCLCLCHQFGWIMQETPRWEWEFWRVGGGEAQVSLALKIGLCLLTVMRASSGLRLVNWLDGDGDGDRIRWESFWGPISKCSPCNWYSHRWRRRRRVWGFVITRRAEMMASKAFPFSCGYQLISPVVA